MTGRKRHILTDTIGLLLQVRVHPADVQDRDGAKLLLAGLAERFPRLAMVWVDGACQGPCATWITETPGWAVTVVRQAQKRVWVGPGVAGDAERLPGLAPALGGRADFRLAGPIPAPERG